MWGSSGLPDPSVVQGLATLAQTQEPQFTAHGTALSTAQQTTTGWYGGDSQSHSLIVQADQQVTQQHADNVHNVAQTLLAVIQLLQYILLLMTIIQLLQLAEAAFTLLALVTGGATLVMAGQAVAGQAMLQAAREAAELALRQLMQAIFEALTKRVLVGAALGAGAGALVAHQTVDGRHESGGQAFMTYLGDMVGGGFTGGMVAAMPGWGSAGVLLGLGHVWAQQEVSGKPMDLQSAFDTVNSDAQLAMLPEMLGGGVKAAETGIQGARAAELTRQADALEGTGGLGTHWAPYDNPAVAFERQAAENTCIPASLRRTLRSLGGGENITDAELNQWVKLNAQGAYLRDTPQALGRAFIKDPEMLARLAPGNPELVAAARAGDLETVSQIFQARSGLSLRELEAATATGVPATVSLRVPWRGMHGVQVDGIEGDWVKLADTWEGTGYKISRADFLKHWQGGQALVLNPEALGLGARADVEEVGWLTRLRRDPLGINERVPSFTEEAPLAGRDPQEITRNFTANLQKDVGAGRATIEPAALDEGYGRPLTTRGKLVNTAIKRYNIAVKEPDFALGGMDDKVWAVGESEQPIAVREDGTLINGHGDPIPSGFDLQRRGYDNRTDQVDGLVQRFDALEQQGHTPPPYYRQHPSMFDNTTKSGWDGAFYESHAEKQAGMIGDQTQPKSLGVSQEACIDCRWYHQTKARVTGVPQVLADPQATRIFEPDGSVIVIPHGSTVAYRYDAQTAYNMWMQEFRAQYYHDLTP